MNFEELTVEWKTQKLPQQLENDFLKELDKTSKSIMSENSKLTYWMTGSIFLTGFIVMPFINDQKLMFILGALWLVIGIQTLIFWLRSITINKSFVQNPKVFISSMISKLKYNLMVTNIFMPIYMLFLGLISSYYLYVSLSKWDLQITTISITLLWVFFVTVFYYGWKKQTKKDKTILIPKIEKLNKIKVDY